VRCEVCGRKIHGKPYRVIIEGAKLTVCSKCAKLGEIIWEETKPKKTALKTRTLKSKSAPLKVPIRKPQPPAPTETNLELIEGYAEKIREVRQRLGLSHQDLGRKINEKTSVLKKIETGKMIPDNRLAAKLEHALKIKLLVPASEEKPPKITVPKTPSRKLTLGDLIQLNSKKKVEEKK